MTKNKIKQDKAFYSRIERGGLDYINQEANYLKISAFIPSFIVISQIIAFILQLILDINTPEGGPSPPLHEILMPMILLIAVGIFALVNYSYLKQWKKELKFYSKQQQIEVKTEDFDKEMESSKKKITLTEIFYDIIKTMNLIRSILVFITVFCGYYYIWYLTFYLRSAPPPHPLMTVIMILTLISQFLLAIYLFYEWHHMLNWNSKLRRIKSYERQIYQELFLDEL